MPMGMADVATVLWSSFWKFDPSASDWFDRDRFVLSAGHGSMLIYSPLYLAGYKNPTIDDIKKFRQLGYPCAGHPENFLLPALNVQLVRWQAYGGWANGYSRTRSHPIY